MWIERNSLTVSSFIFFNHIAVIFYQLDRLDFCFIAVLIIKVYSAKFERCMANLWKSG
ncbi:hypothetical protein D918_03991 [Trichuris suis]|nr:hypothetical protein D918_03991 [Trichuris suis]